MKYPDHHYLENNKSSPNKKLVVVTISPQSRASIAAHYKLSIDETSNKLASFFKSLGADYIYDLTFARDFSLIETANEFIERLKINIENIYYFYSAFIYYDRK